jgi:hypothetical protein
MSTVLKLGVVVSAWTAADALSTGTPLKKVCASAGQRAFDTEFRQIAGSASALAHTHASRKAAHSGHVLTDEW